MYDGICYSSCMTDMNYYNLLFKMEDNLFSFAKPYHLLKYKHCISSVSFVTSAVYIDKGNKMLDLLFLSWNQKSAAYFQEPFC